MMEQYNRKLLAKSFQFKEPDIFNGHLFYEKYKDAEFLKIKDNIDKILWRGHELRWRLKELAPGECIQVEGMFIKKGEPLMVKKRGLNDNVTAYDFTFTRLAGFVAAYVFENRQEYSLINCTESKALGLVWNNQDFSQSALYLSAISGTEHFVKQFHYFPLICALRKFQLKKMPEPLVMKVARIQYLDGRTLVEYISDKLVASNYLWAMFPNNSADDDPRAFQKFVVNEGPKDMKQFFKNIPK